MEESNFSEDYIFSSGQKAGEYTEGLYFSRHTVNRKLRGKTFVCMASAAPMIFWPERENLPPSYR